MEDGEPRRERVITSFGRWGISREESRGGTEGHLLEKRGDWNRGLLEDSLLVVIKNDGTDQRTENWEKISM